jgi:hypothetical protein
MCGKNCAFSLFNWYIVVAPVLHYPLASQPSTYDIRERQNTGEPQLNEQNVFLEMCKLNLFLRYVFWFLSVSLLKRSQVFIKWVWSHNISPCSVRKYEFFVSWKFVSRNSSVYTLPRTYFVVQYNRISQPNVSRYTVWLFSLLLTWWRKEIQLSKGHNQSNGQCDSSSGYTFRSSLYTVTTTVPLLLATLLATRNLGGHV